MTSRIGGQSPRASALTKEVIHDKVMQGQHLMATEKEFVRNGYRVIDRPLRQQLDQGAWPRAESNA